jgi:predicted transcriptional regulator YdeE
MRRLLVALPLLLVSVHAEPSGQSLPMKVVGERAFYVAGYAARTNNANESTGRGLIGNLWGTFLQRHLEAAIPNRMDDQLVVVYSNYAGDEKGDYDYLLGARVSSVERLPAGMTYREVAAGSYAVVIPRAWPPGEAVPEAWKRIWSMRPVELGGRRAFVTDYEVSDQHDADPKHTRVEIHVGVRSTK